jgi:hypothetical protein
VAAAKSAILDSLARDDRAAGGHRNAAPQIQTVRDQMEVRMAGMEQAIMHRVAPGTKLDDNGRQYRGMSLLEIGRDHLESCGIATRGLTRNELAERMLHHRGGQHSTSDFAFLLGNVANKRLRQAYEESASTYQAWARRAPNAPDTRNINVVQLSGAPDLLKVNEAGEYTYGTLTDGEAVYKVVKHGRIVSVTEEAIINDDLKGFDRLLTAFGFSAARLENRLAYSQLMTGVTYSVENGNVQTGAGSGLTADNLAKARTMMRKQTGLGGELLNLAPAYLIAPAALEQTAYQLTSSNYVPATTSAINEFRAGGRTALEPIIEPVLDEVSATAWFLAASSSAVDTVEYCYLDGAEGPVVTTKNGWEVDGIEVKCKLWFAAKAIDHRGLHKAAGA